METSSRAPNIEQSGSSQLRRTLSFSCDNIGALISEDNIPDDNISNFNGRPSSKRNYKTKIASICDVGKTKLRRRKSSIVLSIGNSARTFASPVTNLRSPVIQKHAKLVAKKSVLNLGEINKYKKVKNYDQDSIKSKERGGSFKKLASRHHSINQLVSPSSIGSAGKTPTNYFANSFLSSFRRSKNRLSTSMTNLNGGTKKKNNSKQLCSPSKDTPVSSSSTSPSLSSLRVASGCHKRAYSANTSPNSCRHFSNISPSCSSRNSVNNSPNSSHRHLISSPISSRRHNVVRSSTSSLNASSTPTVESQTNRIYFEGQISPIHFRNNDRNTQNNANILQCEENMLRSLSPTDARKQRSGGLPKNIRRLPLLADDNSASKSSSTSWGKSKGSNFYETSYGTKNNKGGNFYETSSSSYSSIKSNKDGNFLEQQQTDETTNTIQRNSRAYASVRNKTGRILQSPWKREGDFQQSPVSGGTSSGDIKTGRNFHQQSPVSGGTFGDNNVVPTFLIDANNVNAKSPLSPTTGALSLSLHGKQTSPQQRKLRPFWKQRTCPDLIKELPLTNRYFNINVSFLGLNYASN